MLQNVPKNIKRPIEAVKQIGHSTFNRTVPSYCYFL